MGAIKLENLAKSKEENFKRVGTIIERVGIDNVNPSLIRQEDPKLVNFIYNRFRSFKELKNKYKAGELDIYFETTMKKVESEVVVSLDKLKEERKLPLQLLDDEIEDAIYNNMITQENESSFGDEAILSKLDDQEKRLQVLEELVSSVLDASNIIIKQNEELVESNNLLQGLLEDLQDRTDSVINVKKELRLTQEDIIEDIRGSIKKMMNQYTAIKYKEINSVNSRKAYNEVYLKFGSQFDININTLHLALINKANRIRKAEGKSELCMLSCTEKGYRKADIIEELGMLPELYITVKKALNDVK